MTGVHPITLRAWEKRYRLLEPRRSPTGRRLYTEDDVEVIRRVLALKREGVAIGQAKEVLQAEPAAPGRRAVRRLWPELCRRMAAAVAAFDEVGVEAIYAEALASHRVEVVDRLLLLPTLRTVGSRCSKVAGGVAEEHFFSAYVRNKIGARFHHRSALDGGPRILVACAPGEQHEIGLLLFALAAHNAGIRIVLLGANVPIAEAAAAAQRAQCAAIVLSQSIDQQWPNRTEELKAMVAAVRRPVYVGGAAAASHERVIRLAGAVALTGDIESSVRHVGAEIAAAEKRQARRDRSKVR